MANPLGPIIAADESVTHQIPETFAHGDPVTLDVAGWALGGRPDGVVEFQKKRYNRTFVSIRPQ